MNLYANNPYNIKPGSPIQRLEDLVKWCESEMDYLHRKKEEVSAKIKAFQFLKTEYFEFQPSFVDDEVRQLEQERRKLADQYAGMQHVKTMAVAMVHYNNNQQK